MLKFSKEKVVGTAIVEIQLTEDDIENIVVTAFEGGINYWAGLNNSTEGWSDKPRDEPNSTWVTKMLLEGKSVSLYNVEESEYDKEEWTLTLDKIIEGFALNYKERSWDNDLERGDATTADCIVQYALFKKTVFG